MQVMLPGLLLRGLLWLDSGNQAGQVPPMSCQPDQLDEPGAASVLTYMSEPLALDPTANTWVRPSEEEPTPTVCKRDAPPDGGGGGIFEAKYTYSVKPRSDGSPVQVSPSPFTSWLYSSTVITPVDLL